MVVSGWLRCAQWPLPCDPADEPKWALHWRRRGETRARASASREPPDGLHSLQAQPSPVQSSPRTRPHSHTLAPSQAQPTARKGDTPPMQFKTGLKAHRRENTNLHCSPLLSILGQWREWGDEQGRQSRNWASQRSAALHRERASTTAGEQVQSKLSYRSTPLQPFKALCGEPSKNGRGARVHPHFDPLVFPRPSGFSRSATGAPHWRAPARRCAAPLARALSIIFPHLRLFPAGGARNPPAEFCRTLQLLPIQPIQTQSNRAQSLQSTPLQTAADVITEATRSAAASAGGTADRQIRPVSDRNFIWPTIGALDRFVRAGVQGAMRPMAA